MPVVSKSMQTQVLRPVQERGNFGVYKTEAVIRKGFWSKEVRSKIENVVLSCIGFIIAERSMACRKAF